MLVATAPFETIAREAAATLGQPDARIVSVNHPLGGTDQATVRQWADSAVEQVLALLTGETVGDA